MKQLNLENKLLVKQKTIAKSVVVSGFALISGRKIAMTLLPAPPNTGIVFVDIVSSTNIRLMPNNIAYKKSLGHVNSTMLVSGNRSIKTTEHFLAVLNMYGISNLIVKCDEEVPNVDGSGLVFCEALENAGIVEQEALIETLVIDKVFKFGNTDSDNDTYMIIEPYDGYEISLRIDFPNPIGIQNYTFTFKDELHFKNKIAKARSFNSIDNIDYAQKIGIAGSGLISSHIILYDGKVINTKLHFDNEFVRHKILDIIGDMYILSIQMKCRIKANKTSHVFNHEVIRSIQKYYNINI